MIQGFIKALHCKIPSTDSPTVTADVQAIVSSLTVLPFLVPVSQVWHWRASTEACVGRNTRDPAARHNLPLPMLRRHYRAPLRRRATAAVSLLPAPPPAQCTSSSPQVW